MPVEPAAPDELDAVVALIAAEQQRAEGNIVYLGDEVAEIRAELDDLEPDWATTVRVARDDAGELLGAALAEWDVGAGRAWVHGPWVVCDGSAWARWARPLFDAVVAQVPEAIVDREMSGSLANERLAALAGELGWPPSETNYAYTLDADVAAAFPPGTDGGLRSATSDDTAAIAALHDVEFPASYFSAAQLLERAGKGEQIVLVADDEGAVVGYAAGRVQPDGEGYIDFVVVDPQARGGGIGRRLVTALGFRIDASFRGYRSLPIGRQM